MIQRIEQLTKYYGSLLNWDLARIYLTVPRSRTKSNAEHVDAAVQWLFRAQDAFGTGGVARSYAIAYNRFFKRRGWIPCYPETTGYIIPTVFDYARRTGSEEAFSRAVRMADWECEVQMPKGAVQGGTVNEPPTPAIFNTGQVIFGWVRAFQETGNERYLASAVRAGEFLVSTQDPDGAWRKNLGQYTSGKMESYTYNTRTAWALLVLGEETGKQAYTDAAVRNIEFALGEQLPNGWFKNNCLSDPHRPLLHTIAYALRGVLEVGIAVHNPVYISSVRKAADALLEKQREDGSLAGRFDNLWEPTVKFSCLTGNAQMGIVWGRLHQVTGDKKYMDGTAKANRFLKSVQWLGTGNPGLDGGISGSYPVHGRYGRFEVLNWAVKFFVDSLMLETSIVEKQKTAAT
jgi:hypothetical protein